MKLLVAIKTFVEKDSRACTISELKTFWASCNEAERLSYKAELESEGFAIDD